MKKNKLLLIMISAVLAFAPFYVNATEDATGSDGQTEVGDQTTGSETEEGGSQESVTPSPNPSVTPTPSPSTTPDVKKSISLEETKITLDPNKSAKLTVTVTPEDAEVIWESSDEKVATVDNKGNVTAGKNKGTATIIVKLKDNDAISASCKVEVNASTDATLKSLTIENGTLDRTFKSDIFEYSVTVDSTVNALVFTDLQADLSDSEAGYMVPSASNKNLKNGSVVKVVVTAEDGKTQNEYKLTIIKDTISLNLKSLSINGYALNEVFDANKLEYTASIPYEIETITIKASPEDSDNEVKVSGLTNLKVGENTVTVVVKDGSGNSRTYTIVVTREEEVSVEENPTSIITSSNITNNNSSTTTTPDKGNNGDSDDFLKYAIVSLACLILFAIGGIGVYFYIKTSPKKLKKEVFVDNMEESPIVEAINEDIPKNQTNIEQIMEEKLIETREFKQEDLSDTNKTENLFDDSQDV